MKKNGRDAGLTEERTLEPPVMVDDVMQFLHISRSQLYEFMNVGVVPYHQLGGSRRFYLSEVDAALRSM